MGKHPPMNSPHLLSTFFLNHAAGLSVKCFLEEEGHKMSNIIKWLSYQFYVHDFEALWKDLGGIYIFAGVNNQHQWVALYIGKTDSFHTRIPSHEQWSLAVRLGATHVHAMVVEDGAQRATIEGELIRVYQPQLNQQLKSLWT
jgi:hypothetical protein